MIYEPWFSDITLVAAKGEDGESKRQATTPTDNTAAIVAPR